MESILQFFESAFGWPAADFWATTYVGVGGYALWSMTHLIMLGAAVLAAVLFGVLYHFCRRRGRKAMQIVFTSLGFAAALAYQAELLFKTHSWTESALPVGICGLTLLFMLLNTMEENGYCTEWLFAAALPVSLLSLVFPAWRGLPVWSCAHLCRYLLPTFVLIYAVMTLFGGNLPSLKRLPAIAFTLLALGAGLYFLNPILETNYWYLSKCGAGLPWTWFVNLFGEKWYLLGLPCAAYGIWFVTYLPLSLIAGAVKKNRVSKRLKAAFEDLPDISAWDKPAESPEPAAPVAPQPQPQPETVEEQAPVVVEIATEETTAPAEETPVADTIDTAEITETIETVETPVPADENPAVTDDVPAQETPEASEEPEATDANESAAIESDTPNDAAEPAPVEEPIAAPEPLPASEEEDVPAAADDVQPDATEPEADAPVGEEPTPDEQPEQN